MPTIMITKMVTFCIMWLNAFAPKSSISSTYSPQTILYGSNLNYKQHCKVPFGAYMQTHKENAPTNSMDDRSIGVIALGPSFNLQGGYKFLNLSTGQIINRQKFTELPMPQIVINRVEELATTDGKDGNTIFTNRAGAKIANIQGADEYEDWPADANLTRVDLQLAQDQQDTVNSYLEEEDKDTHTEGEAANESDLGPPPPHDNTESETEKETEPENDNENKMEHET
eukprot:3463224-Ditylum_brightwellii.AAC.1